MKWGLACSSPGKIEVFTSRLLSAAAVHTGVVWADPRARKFVFPHLSLVRDQGCCGGVLNHGVPQLAAWFLSENCALRMSCMVPALPSVRGQWQLLAIAPEHPPAVGLSPGRPV